MKFFCPVNKTVIQSRRCCAKGRNSADDRCLIPFCFYYAVNVHISRIDCRISQRQICYILPFFQFFYNSPCCIFIIPIQNLSVLCHRRIQIQEFFFFHVLYHPCCNPVADRMFPASRRHCEHLTFLYDTHCLICHKFRISRSNSDSE